MGKTQEIENNSINLIGNGTSIVGEVNSPGDIRFDGKLNGTLIVKGKLVIGPTGEIEGEIKCKNADISGKVDGKVNVSELLTLKSTAKIHGDIITNKIAIEPGAVFTGTCKMEANLITETFDAKEPPKK